MLMFLIPIQVMTLASKLLIEAKPSAHQYEVLIIIRIAQLEFRGGEKKHYKKLTPRALCLFPDFHFLGVSFPQKPAEQDKTELESHPFGGWLILLQMPT